MPMMATTMSSSMSVKPLLSRIRMERFPPSVVVSVECARCVTSV
jgi:hypothetical protein